MTAEPTLAAALEREHREIDAGISAYLASCADGSHDTAPLLQAMDALRRHIYLEEAFLFPPLRDAGLFAPILVMLREHGEIWSIMDAVATQLGGDPASGPSEGRCLALLTQLEQHNFKEEAVIYPQADTTLSADLHAELRTFLATGQMPSGWVCEKRAS